MLLYFLKQIVRAHLFAHNYMVSVTGIWYLWILLNEVFLGKIKAIAGV